MNINDQVCEALGDSLKFALWNEQFSDLTFNVSIGITYLKREFDP